MSNYPKVYGFCDAGCRRRVPTYDEFLQSASIVKMDATDGEFTLEVGKKYRIAKMEKNATTWGFVITAKIRQYDSATQSVYATLSLPSCTKYDKYLTIRVLDVVLGQLEVGGRPMYVVAEVNGKIEQISTSQNTNSKGDCEIKSVTVSLATECFLVNEDANIVLDPSGGEMSEEVEQRLADVERKLADMDYKKITASLLVSPSTAEIGSSVTNAKLTWSTSKETSAITLDGSNVTGTSYTDSKTYTSNKTWTLKATEKDRGETATPTATLSFLNGVYYGVSTNPAIKASNRTEILEFTKELRSNKKPSFTANAGAGQYIYYCLPTRMGTCSFKVGGFDGGFSLVDEGSFQNASGYSENYYIYRSENAALGSTSVTVS